MADLKALGDLVVAFSGGVDSSVLLHAAHSALGKRAVGLIADSPSLPRRELAQARELAQSMGAQLVVLRTQEFEREAYLRNDAMRCYWCKRSLFEAMGDWARRSGFSHLAFGEISDDAWDDRPGALAAKELLIAAPLARAGMGKQDVRRYAKEAGLAVHDKPASACLASRITRGRAVTIEALARVEKAEEALLALGFSVLRVRDLGQGVRVEVGSNELDRAKASCGKIQVALAESGYVDSGDFELTAYVSPGQPPTQNPNDAG